MIYINEETNIESLEDAYNLLSNDNTLDIKICNNFSNLNFGLVPSIIQFFSTWYNNSNGKIIFDIEVLDDLDSISESEIEKLSDYYLRDFYKIDFLFSSIVYCWKKEIQDLSGNNIKQLLKFQNEKLHIKMMKQEVNGFKAILSCFDHLGTKKGLLNAFYLGDSFIDNELQLDFAIDKTLSKVLSLNKELLKRNYGPFHQDIIAVIYELIKNTHEWAQTDILNKPLNPNTRGIYLKIHRRTRQSYLNQYKDNIAFANFFSEKNFDTNSNNELYFLEISVFDTGIGFVQRFTNNHLDNITVINQIEIIKECLLVNNTSTNGRNKLIKGKGLDRIMNILDGKGVFTLRTGNVSIYRNLISHKYKLCNKSNDIELFDVRSNSQRNFTRMSTSRGSVLMLIFPLTDLNND